MHKKFSVVARLSSRALSARAIVHVVPRHVRKDRKLLLAPRKGFVFLAFSKAASTSIERAFGQYADGAFYANPFKHTRYDSFQRHMQPFLKAKGFGRGSYEVVCVMRDPIDWLFSWWRYRSRDELARSDRARKRNHYAGEITFEEFVRAYMRRESGDDTEETAFTQVGRPIRFVQPLPGKRRIDRVFRYERLDLLVDYLRDKVGKKVQIGTENVSPAREFSLTEQCHRELRAFLEPDYEVYEKAIGG